MWKYWKNTIAIIFCIATTYAAQAQALGYAQQYNDGAVVLADGSKLRGVVMLYPSRGVVQVKMANDSVYTFQAQAVQCVAVEEHKERITADKLVSPRRVFRPYYVMSKNPGGPIWAFFEQISDGPVKLLRYQRFMPYAAMSASYTPSTDNFFLALGSNGVVPLRYPRKDVLSFFKKQAPQIEQYVKENDLRYTNARELSFIVNYANSLQNAPGQ
ncbi:hypothetical protein [Hymenobacter crusticola]|uniref:DUF4468 domain-containing protein n=1 Tax=Hymenobacter crusticola TaxID=1770526 RepID=A0A243WFM4_9BACT|nr:hypothetical protein [Hymenobacter crusticola]OUJ74290.1 hypothetical protein BXP70_11265 [Hymenobacter crusticola]